MRNELLHTVGIHTIIFIMFKAIQIIIYTVPLTVLSTVDGELLLFPVWHYLLLNTQYEGQWPEVVITWLLLQILSSFKIKNRPIHQAIHICFGANGRQLPAWNKTTSGLLSLWSLWHVTSCRTSLAYIPWDLLCAETYNIDLYTVLISAVDGEILLLPVRVRHVENARESLPTLWYTCTSLRRIALNSTE